MREEQFSTIATTELDGVVGGNHEGDNPNYQHDVIGVKAGDATVGMEKNGGLSDYGLCLKTGKDLGWTPEQFATNCTPVHTDGN